MKIRKHLSADGLFKIIGREIRKIKEHRAFAVDQAQQLAYQFFQAAWHKAGSKRFLWERMRALFYELPMPSMTAIWRAIAYGFYIEGQIIIHDTT